ncbi:hypothetical protein AB0K60_31135 [Thermopolyspora sp. NPDC052614]|uniref:hypothetical protein n=1 Tax=Thermopolyspora sp. NPDC052614 TaxID=3155682 RepID=UPI003440761E
MTINLEVGGAARHDETELSLLAGEHALYTQGDLQAARRWFDEAYRQADERGDVPALARAALGLGGVWVHEHRSVGEAAVIRARQHRALSLTPPDSVLALRLRARVTGEEDYRTGRHTAILALVNEARRAGDPVALAETLSLAHHCVLGPDHDRLRLELVDRLIGAAVETGRRGDLVMGVMRRTADLFLAGDPHAERALEELRGMLAVEDHLAAGFVVGAMEVMLAIRAGRFDEAETLAGDCADRGAAAGDIDATGWYGGQIAAIRWFQGRLTELLPLLADMVNSPSLSAVDNSYLAGLAVAAANAGEHRLALSALARLRGRSLTALPRNSTWLTTMFGVAEAAYLLRDADVAAEVYALLTPFAGLPVVTSLGVACFGSVRHALGMAALAMGDVDRAVDHLREAAGDNLALGHWPATVLSRWRLGQALAVRLGPSSPEARKALSWAETEAAALGMTLPPAVKQDGEPATRPAADPGEPTRCERHGRQWRLTLGGRSVLVGHSVGMRHLATLIANPGREIHAAELAAGPGLTDASFCDAGGSAQPVLDEVAKREYKRRLSELEADIDEFEAMNELDRAATLRAERDWLIAELAAATGLAGRARRFTDDEERARIAVGKAIRRALTRVAEADPVIGEELRATVHTGLRCCYIPR